MLERGKGVPDRIVVAFVAKLRLYGFWGGRGPFTELWRILEKKSVAGQIRRAGLANDGCWSSGVVEGRMGGEGG